MPEQTPYFSVIIVTYNRAKLLRSALESLRLQTFKDYEAFIIDDGSTDTTKEVFAQYKNNHNWHFIFRSTNKGYPYAKNMAFGQARGRYITFLDSDDIWLKNRLETFHDFSEINPNYGFIFSNGFIFQDGLIISQMFDVNKNVPSGKLPAYMAVSGFWLPYVTTNVSIRKDCVDATGFYNENMLYLGDTEYFARVLEKFECGSISEPLSVYRIHPVSLTQNREECIRESLLTLDIAKPPAQIYTMLHDLIYLEQAVVLLKNGLSAAARNMIKNVRKRNSRYVRILVLSYIPWIIVLPVRFMYKLLRVLKLRLFADKEFKKAESFLFEMDSFV